MPFPFNVYLFALLGGGLTTALSLPLWRAWCERTGTMDDPGHRKIHSAPIALAGGLAVMTGLIVPLLVGTVIALFHSHSLFNSLTVDLFRYGLSRRAVPLIGIMTGALGMFLIGLWDDRVELSPALKLGGQLLVALLVAAAGLRVTLFVHSLLFSYAMTVLWILTVVNAFNFIDNMNGLCAGLGAIASISFAVIAAASGQYLVATMALLIAGALAFFLPSNFPKARVFLGDAGSHLVGFLLAVLAILPHFSTPRQPHPWAVLKPLLILGVPLADLVWVVALRWKLGKPIYVGDNNHLSHFLVRRGWSQTRAVLLLWLVAAILGAAAILWT